MEKENKEVIKEEVDDKWREKNICHICNDRDNCDDGKKRNHINGSIVVNCTGFK